jgi:hypothetical protein
VRAIILFSSLVALACLVVVAALVPGIAHIDLNARQRGGAGHPQLFRAASDGDYSLANGLDYKVVESSISSRSGSIRLTVFLPQGRQPA